MMIDKLIEDWYSDTVRRKPAPQPKPIMIDPAVVLAKIYDEEMKKRAAIEAQPESIESPVWVKGPGRPTSFTPAYPGTWQGDGGRQFYPSYPSGITRLPYDPNEAEPKAVPLPYDPREGGPKFTLFSNATSADPSPTYSASDMSTGCADPGLLQAQQENDRRLSTGFPDPGLLEAQKVNDKPSIGFADPGLLQAQKANEQIFDRGTPDPGRLYAEQALRPDLYPNNPFVDLNPGDDGKNNPYGINVNEFLRWVYSQLGYHEKASDEYLDNNIANSGANNWTKYGKWYGQNGGDLSPWCAMFTSWCANQAGISKSKIPESSSTSTLKEWYADKRVNRFASILSDYAPKAGDLIFYQDYNNKGDLVGGHTAVVVAYKPGPDKEHSYVYTIDGNLNDMVYFRKVSMTKPNLVGFGMNGANSYGILPSHYFDETGKVV